MAEQERNAVQLTARDLYRLHRARLLAQRASLRAQFADQQLQEFSLDLERRYGLLTKEAVLDVQTGMIQVPGAAANGRQAFIPVEPEEQEEVSCGPADDADQGPS